MKPAPTAWMSGYHTPPMTHGLRRAAVAAVLAAALAGCSSYPGRRGADLADVVTIGGETAGTWLFPLNVSLRCTDIAHAGIGLQGGMGRDGPEPLPRGFGWTRFRTLGVYSVTEMNLGFVNRRVLAAGRTTGKRYREGLYAEDECDVFVHALSGRRQGARSFADFLDIEGAACAGLGFRIALRPGELADFLAGLATLDPSRDDDGIRPPDGPAQPPPAPPAAPAPPSDSP